MEKEREFVRLNSHAISLKNSKEEIVNEFTQCIEKSVLYYNLYEANADVTLLFLQAWIKKHELGQITKESVNRVFLRFISCSFDERFFIYLRETWANRFNIELYFTQYCRFNFADTSDVEEIPKCFAKFGRGQVNLFKSEEEVLCSRDVIFKFQAASPRDLSFDEVGGSYACSADKKQPGKSRGISFPSFRTFDDDETFGIGDSRLFLSVLSLPNLTNIDIAFHCMDRFLVKVFGEFCKRPKSALPCTLNHEDYSSLQITQQFLDHFNDPGLKLENLRLYIGDSTSDLTKRALEVLSKSTNLKHFVLYFEYDSADMCHSFVHELGKIVTRMRPFYCRIEQVDGDWYRMDNHDINDWEQIITKSRKIAKDYWRFMVIAVGVTLCSHHSLRNCSLKMLQSDLLANLYEFICGEIPKRRADASRE